ncbi:2-hydroxyacid dehydrogenase [Oceanobacter mangrovi]|uniref:2-hydroxyacid dehydrogenase n=1 Tax=Oceanobacter mangrovi TaxID=2862510 RepID=UPI001C8DDBF6|nr:glyoxylate/hydroxypyruvate reductase A [Oceanobacter mangrovi]
MSADLKIVFATNDNALADRLISRMESWYPHVSVCKLDDPAAAEAEVAACWYPPEDLLQRCPNLKLLQAISAGVDHIGDALLASGVPICRVVDEGQKHGMLEYVLWGMLHYQRDFDLALANQANKVWKLHPQRRPGRMRVGVMGLGQLGGYIAEGLVSFGYSVSGWSRTDRHFDQVSCYAGEAEMTEFLANCDAIINLLPLTPATDGILNASLFERLPQGAVVMNCGRGEHLNEADLIAALASGHLRGAILDVFPKEPLAQDNPLWTTPGVVITPHMASSASGKAILGQLVDNGRHVLEGLPLMNLVDSEQGY